jgi:hypothetical protein
MQQHSLSMAESSLPPNVEQLYCYAPPGREPLTIGIPNMLLLSSRTTKYAFGPVLRHNSPGLLALRMSKVA